MHIIGGLGQESLEEARAMAIDCLHGYLETKQEFGQALPESEEYIANQLKNR